jgi:hypothetical protein
LLSCSRWIEHIWPVYFLLFFPLLPNCSLLLVKVVLFPINSNAYVSHL